MSHWSRNQIVDLKINSQHPIKPIFHVESTKEKKGPYDDDDDDGDNNEIRTWNLTFCTITASHRTLLINSET